MKFYYKLIVTLVCLAIFATTSNSAMAKPLFENSEPLTAVLSAPFKQLYRQKKKEVRLYEDATLSYQDKHQSGKLDLKIRTRGNFRRLNCRYPPLRLNFVKKANDGTLFERQNKLKLVGPCQRGGKFEQYVALEYLAYKVWEDLSPYHLKTRLIKMNYMDTEGKRKPRTNTTFVIEDIDDAAKRVNRKLLKIAKVQRRNLNRESIALLEMFQLFIGNTDYSTIAGPAGANCCHNVRLIAEKSNPSSDNDNIIAIPYDFDVSGIVNAPYATPADGYPITDVRRRYFSGTCKEERHFRAAIERFNQRKNVLYDLISSIGVLDGPSQKKTLKYFDSFYELINDPARVNKEILGRCRGVLLEG